METIAPIEKKQYKATRPQKKLQDFEVFFWNHLHQQANCSAIYTIRNSSSRNDFFLTSGDSLNERSLVCEWKTRNDVSVTKYHYCLAEEKKVLDLLEIARLVDGIAYYFVQYKEAIVAWRIDPNLQYKKDVLSCPVELGSRVNVDKSIIQLEFKDADIVVARKNWKRSNAKELQVYILKEKIKAVEELKGYDDPKIEQDLNYLNGELQKMYDGI